MGSGLGGVADRRTEKGEAVTGASVDLDRARPADGGHRRRGVRVAVQDQHWQQPPGAVSERRLQAAKVLQHRSEARSHADCGKPQEAAEREANPADLPSLDAGLLLHRADRSHDRLHFDRETGRRPERTARRRARVRVRRLRKGLDEEGRTPTCANCAVMRIVCAVESWPLDATRDGHCRPTAQGRPAGTGRRRRRGRVTGT